MNKKTDNKFIFTSFSKRNFYLRSAISAFVLGLRKIPISPFMNFDYNLEGTVNKDLIRTANNTLIKRCDELWVFGEISDGVLVEIYLAQKNNMPVRFFVYDQTINKFNEISRNNVVLEDVSPWVWEMVNLGRKLDRWHPRLRFNRIYPVIYPAYSKKNFFWQMHISKFCLEKKKIPLNPFMLFRCFLGDSVDRKNIYEANNNIVEMCDELWVFGEISDGVLKEIKLKEKAGGKVRYFKIIDGNPVGFRKILKKKAVPEKV
jgi:hypothetical protein